LKVGDFIEKINILDIHFVNFKNNPSSNTFTKTNRFSRIYIETTTIP